MVSNLKLAYLSKWIKPLAGLLGFIYLFFTLWGNDRLVIPWKAIDTHAESIQVWIIVVSTILLGLINWGFETIKWQLLLQSIVKIRWRQALNSVLTGISAGFFTPNRVGEFAGRLAFLEPQYRMEGVALSWVGSLSQLLVTILAGLVCLLVRNLGAHPIIPWLDGVLFASAVLGLLSFYFFFSINSISQFFNAKSDNKKLKKILEVWTNLPLSIRFNVFSLSAMRYLIFSLQFYFLLLLFKVNISMGDSLQVTGVIFMMNTLIPTEVISELGVRGAVAVYFLHPYCTQEFNILAATYSLWLINLGLPSVAGLITYTLASRKSP